MSIRDLIPGARNSVPVTRGQHPVRRFQDEMNGLFDDFFYDFAFPAWPKQSQVRTAIDLEETDKDYVVTAEVPGIHADDLSLSVADGYLTLKGERKQDVTEEKGGFTRRERSYGSFQRVIAMPETADLDFAKAEVSNGVLKVTVPKKELPKIEAKRIEIAHA